VFTIDVELLQVREDMLYFENYLDRGTAGCTVTVRKADHPPDPVFSLIFSMSSLRQMPLVTKHLELVEQYDVAHAAWI
jgi:hypothetical protein